MGLFKRKDGKPPSVHDEKSDRASVASSHSAHLSLKSPRPVPALNGFADMSLPKIPLPAAPDPTLDPAGYLRSIYAVRERSKIVLEKAKENDLNHFDVDMTKFSATSAYVVSIIKSWPSTVDPQERTRRLLDLFLVSVLLDAGAGTKWSYKSKESGKKFNRSEGLAVASLEMFKTGIFSSDPSQPFRVDAGGLKNITVETLTKGMQVSEDNPMDGLEGRAGLLMRLSKALYSNEEYFGPDARPGNMLDYLISHPTTQASSVPIVALPTLWKVLMDGLAAIWPKARTQIAGVSLGDAWPCSDMPASPPARSWENIVPFHKLTQWLCYSLMVPMTKLLSIHFAGAELMTGLPEYRNGGLLIDTGLLSLKPADMERGVEAYKRNAQHKGAPNVEVVPLFEPSDDVVVEWRAVTVGFLDELLEEVNKGLNLTGKDKLSLAQMLEAGTWKGGREIAAYSRPNTREPPIMILSDGTVF
ncbi:putative conserved fungal protein [Phaeomoniella chlamydospora]|uniref:Putative conserved fungal protein n=1 Tax=Phaeomoniella chlamydospora TaxID=158046 RepID=A0A0G2ENK2_PHACM|nr:putative conserved fungal protein [Phaeomoniella chlamydospora]